jgi:cell division transport system permease protein
LQTVRGVGFALAVLMAMAAGVTVATVVRLGLHARREEVEIMELVGSPLLFVRGPFVAEGLMQGGLGALLALLLLAAGHGLVQTWWGNDLQTVLEGGRVAFLPARFQVGLVFGGMVLGGVGGFAASRQAGRGTAALTAAQRAS